VSNINIRHIDNRKLLLICILLLSHSLIFLGSFFIKYVCNLCIFIGRGYVFLLLVYVFLLLVYVFLSLSVYSYC